VCSFATRLAARGLSACFLVWRDDVKWRCFSYCWWCRDLPHLTGSRRHNDACGRAMNEQERVGRSVCAAARDF
jgi:hypothetical protein